MISEVKSDLRNQLSGLNYLLSHISYVSNCLYSLNETEEMAAPDQLARSAQHAGKNKCRYLSSRISTLQKQTYFINEQNLLKKVVLGLRDYTF